MVKDLFLLYRSSRYDHGHRSMSRSPSYTRTRLSTSSMVTIKLSRSEYREWTHVVRLGPSTFFIGSGQTMRCSNTLQYLHVRLRSLQYRCKEQPVNPLMLHFVRMFKFYRSLQCTIARKKQSHRDRGWWHSAPTESQYRSTRPNLPRSNASFRDPSQTK